MTATPLEAGPIDAHSYAGLVSRAGAAVIDVIVFAIVSAGSLFFLQAASALLHRQRFGEATVSSVVAGATIAFLVVVYFAGAWTITGRTVGEAVLGLRVVRPDGNRVKLLRALLRCAVSFVSIAAIGLGFAWILVDRRRRSWQDIAAGTVVVYSFGRTDLKAATPPVVTPVPLHDRA